MNLLAYEDVIKSMYEDGHTDTEISYRLSELGMQRGNSERNVRKFRSEKGLKRKCISEDELELAVSQAVVEVRFFFYCYYLNKYLKLLLQRVVQLKFVIVY